MRKLLLPVLFCLIQLVATAQSVQIDGVRPKEFKGVKSIENKGYYTFYINEKIGKGMVEFNLDIYDLDLKLIKRVPIQITKNSVMIGGEFNGKDFLFAFSDIGKKTNTFVTIDERGNFITQQIVKAKKFVTAGSTAIYPSMDGDGFFVTQTVKEKKWGYSVEKFDRNLKSLWEKTVTNPRGIIGIEATESGHGRLFIMTVERPTLMSRKVFGNIVAMDGKTGNQIYEYPLFDGTITGIPSAFLIDRDGSVATAGMYFNGEKWDDVNSDGIFFLKISPDGKKVAHTPTDWDNGIQAALKATSRKFSIGSKPKVLFHEIIQDEAGNYQIISETFRKTVKAGTVMAAMAGNNQQDIPVGFTVMDFIIFNYDKAGKMLDINKIEKPYKSILVDGQLANMGGVRLAYYLKEYKMFTYEFTTKLPGTNQQVIVYTNFEDAGLGKGKPYVGISTIKRGEESKTTKIPLSKKLANFVTGGNPENIKTGAIKSKPGYTCMYYYDRKTKSINLALEELKLD